MDLDDRLIPHRVAQPLDKRGQMSSDDTATGAAPEQEDRRSKVLAEYRTTLLQHKETDAKVRSSASPLLLCSDICMVVCLQFGCVPCVLPRY